MLSERLTLEISRFCQNPARLMVVWGGHCTIFHRKWDVHPQRHRASELVPRGTMAGKPSGRPGPGPPLPSALSLLGWGGSAGAPLQGGLLSCACGLRWAVQGTSALQGTVHKLKPTHYLGELMHLAFYLFQFVLGSVSFPKSHWKKFHVDYILHALSLLMSFLLQQSY